MPRTRTRRPQLYSPSAKEADECVVSFGDTASCIAKLRGSHYRWISNLDVIVTTASEVSAKFLHELAECLGIQDDPIALSIDNVPLYFHHTKRLTLGRIQGSIMHESIQNKCYYVQNGEIIDMPDTTIVVFPLK